MLTPKQEKFCRGIVDGMKQAEAYKNAYNAENMADNSVYVEASKLMDNPNVAQRIAELRGKIDNRLVMSATKRAEKLTEFIESDDPSVAMKAIDILNKMTGEYTQKVEASVSQEIDINISLEE